MHDLAGFHLRPVEDSAIGTPTCRSLTGEGGGEGERGEGEGEGGGEGVGERVIIIL